MAAKRRTAGKRRSKTKGSSGIPAWFWLLGGILIGLGAAVALMFKGYLPELKQQRPAVDSKPATTTDAALLDDTKAAEPQKPRYDFFTVLPEMEVVVPEQELLKQANRKPEPAANNDPATPATTAVTEQYVLQVGSFRSAADAEQMKARLAMMGSSATVQSVTVNDQTWHRVRIGPFNGARKATEMRRMLADNQIDTLVMKVKP